MALLLVGTGATVWLFRPLNPTERQLVGLWARHDHVLMLRFQGDKTLETLNWITFRDANGRTSSSWVTTPGGSWSASRDVLVTRSHRVRPIWTPRGLWTYLSYQVHGQRNPIQFDGRDRFTLDGVRFVRARDGKR